MKLLISRIALSVALLFAATSALAGELLVDCNSRALPSQAAIGEMLGEHNFGMVYATRSRLMVEASRACHRQGTSHVRLVFEAAGSSSPASRRGVMAQEVALVRK